MKLLQLTLDSTFMIYNLKLNKEQIDEINLFIEESFKKENWTKIGNSYWLINDNSDYNPVLNSVILMQLTKNFNDKFKFKLSNILKNLEIHIIKETQNFLPIMLMSDSLL